MKASTPAAAQAATSPQPHVSPHRRADHARFLEFRINLTRKLVDMAAQVFAQNSVGIQDGTFRKPLLEADAFAKEALGALKAFARARIFTSREAIDIELSGFRILQDLLQSFSPLLRLERDVFAGLDPSAGARRRDMALEQRLYSLLPHRQLHCYRHEAGRPGGAALEPVFRTHLLVDYLSGMTDSHAVKVYNMLSGIAVGGRI